MSSIYDGVNNFLLNNKISTQTFEKFHNPVVIRKKTEVPEFQSGRIVKSPPKSMNSGHRLLEKHLWNLYKNLKKIKSMLV